MGLLQSLSFMPKQVVPDKKLRTLLQKNHVNNGSTQFCQSFRTVGFNDNGCTKENLLHKRRDKLYPVVTLDGKKVASIL